MSNKSRSEKKHLFLYFCLDEDHHKDSNLFVLYPWLMFFAKIQKLCNCKSSNEMTEFHKIRSERARQFAGQRSYTCRFYIK